MVGNVTKAARKGRKNRNALGRDAWLKAARNGLIEEGTAGVEVNKLAKRLKVTRGGFYWFFKSREQLLDELLRYWADTSTRLFNRVLQSPGCNGLREFRVLADLWVNEREYDPKWDAAVRDWARTSTQVRRTVEAVDKRRLGIIEQIFLDMGYEGMDAKVRARVTYYHQVGYYALGIRQSRRERLELLPYYEKMLVGSNFQPQPRKRRLGAPPEAPS